MFWQRILLGVAIIAMSVTLFVPLPLWLAASLMVISLVAALVVVLTMARRRRT
ncbi:MAG: hypothetical protein HLX51_02620 [Micrococcaceae bacterium]|uniref:hypothetical protein n=1 Tax=Yaniella flava TaxID=287930 RepID=UPI001809942B|nr:hypothetical protein [Micrococcaceae bacterium]